MLDSPIKLIDIKFEGIEDKAEEEFLKRALLQFQKSHCCFPCKYQKVYLIYHEDKIANYLKPDNILNLCIHFQNRLPTGQPTRCYNRCSRWENIE